MTPTEKRNISVPFLFCFSVRLLVYFLAIQNGHHTEGDSQAYLDYTNEFFNHGTVEGGNWLPPGYFIFLGILNRLLGWGHYGVLAFQNAFGLLLAFLLMKEVKANRLACWAIALVSACDLSSVLYASAIMNESLSLFLFTLGWYLALRKGKLFWGSFFFGLSCTVRAGNFPFYLCFLTFIFLYGQRPALKRISPLLLGAFISVAPLIVYDGVRFNSWKLSVQGDYHWVTLGAGIIMRQKNVTWVEGETQFTAYHRALLASGNLSRVISPSKTLFQALMIYILENPRAFVWSIVRGFGTQFLGGQNAELLHRYKGRNIEKWPLPAGLHISMITVHALWMVVVWGLFLWSIPILWKSPADQLLALFTVAACVYFFITVATLAAPRFRIPCMPAVALCVALAISRRKPLPQEAK